MLFCLGIWTAHYFRIPFLFSFAAAAAFFAAGLAVLRSRFWFLFAALSIISLGACAFSLSRTCSAENAGRYKPGDIRLEAVVVSDPALRVDSYGLLKGTFTAKADNGLVKVRYYPRRDLSIEYGDRILLNGILKDSAGFAERDAFDYGGYLTRRGIFGVITVKRSGLIRVIAKDQAGAAKKTILRFKHRLKERIFQYVPGIEAQLLYGILLGDRYEVPPYLKKKFISTGTIHILAISGLHMGLIALIFIIAFRLLRIKDIIAYPAVIAAVILYCILTGANVPAVRATIMITAFITAELLKRKGHILNMLGLSGLAILIFNPQQIFDAGFQLSFMSVVSIVVLMPVILQIVRYDIKANNIIKYFKQAFSVSLAAWLGIAPVAAWHFQLFTPISVIANIPIVAMLTFMVACGMTFFTVCFISPFFAELLGLSCQFIARSLIYTADAFSRAPFAGISVKRPEPYFIALFYLVLAVIIVNVRHKKR